jgi:hypothetical protein
MSKSVTISSLVRQAARSEGEFYGIILRVFEEEEPERVAEFFDRLNVPRSVEGDNFNEPLPTLSAAFAPVSSFPQEHAIHLGIQKYMERHLKKLKWHAQRPSIEGGRNVLLVMREGMVVTDLRLARLHALLQLKDELTPIEWSQAREMMNKGYLAFRRFLEQVGIHWIDQVVATQDRAELEELVGNFYELIDITVRKLEEHRHKIEERRMELSVCPEEFDPVKPPPYFGGDLLHRGPWKQFWLDIEKYSHHFREALN